MKRGAKKVYWKCRLWRHKLVTKGGITYCARPACTHFYTGVVASTSEGGLSGGEEG
jgi:hypothetical protein